MMNPEGKWCIYDPRLPGFVAEYTTMLEARSWMEMTQPPDTELTVVFVPGNYPQTERPPHEL